MKQIEKKLNEIAAKFESKPTVVINGKFNYNFETNTISVKLEIDDNMRLFAEWFTQNFYLPSDFEQTIFIINFLHEIGHAEMWDLTKDHENYNPALRAWYREFEHLLNSEQSVEIYTSLFEEKIANAWTADYINEDWEIINQWSNELENIYFANS